jgi:hypothetical protein
VGGPQPNNGMHPTADTPAVKIINLTGRRVIGSVGRHAKQRVDWE